MTEVLCAVGGAVVGFVAGIFFTVQLFLAMHAKSLPPKQ